jgi:ribosomal subunit interface protein
LATQQIQLSVSTEGPVPPVARQRAEDKLGQLALHIREPVLYAEIRLVNDHTPARARPAIAEATLSINGTPVRAHVAAGDLDSAIDLLEERLKRRITRHEERLHREGKERHRSQNGSNGHDWRHGDHLTQRPEWHERPPDEREVVRHKTFALDPLTIDEAAFDLDALAHDFYLFTELETGADAVISYDDDHGLCLQLPEGVGAVAIEQTAVPVRQGASAPTLTLVDAEDRLDDGGERFVFFIDQESGRGHVVYHRFDGHYGLITPAR